MLIKLGVYFLSINKWVNGCDEATSPILLCQNFARISNENANQLYFYPAHNHLFRNRKTICSKRILYADQLGKLHCKSKRIECKRKDKKSKRILNIKNGKQICGE